MCGCSINQQIIEKLKGKIIVSCQAAVDEPFYNIMAMTAMVKSVINGGAGGLRLAGAYHISHIRKITDLPIIGITKPDIIPANYKELVYITPSFSDAKQIHDAGTDIIAIDSTSRPRPQENLTQLINLIHKELHCPVMADISNLEEALIAQELGADIISTTLAGYTNYTEQTAGPDFALLEKLVNIIKTPVILEGRIETPEHAKRAFESGAYAVVIGSIITRPHLITGKFVEVLDK